MANKVKLVSSTRIYLDANCLLDHILDITPNFPRQYKSINSYLGLLRQCNEYGNRVKVLSMIEPQAWQYIYIKGHYELVCLRNKYKPKTITLQRIRDGDY